MKLICFCLCRCFIPCFLFFTLYVSPFAERAWMKLKLDAVVVQQGRLAEAKNKLSKEEMLEMVQVRER